MGRLQGAQFALNLPVLEKKAILDMKNNESNELHPNDLISSLPMRQRELLRVLAEQDGRNELAELLWLIEARAVGRLRDVGDALESPIVPQELQPQSLGRTQGIVFERVRGQSGSPKRPHLPPTSPLPSTDH